MGDPKEVLEVVRERDEKQHRHWLDSGNFVNWEDYPGQFYDAGSRFLYNDQGRPTLMKTRHFSFGFTESDDKKTGSSVLIQHDRNELRTRQSFDQSAEWLSFYVSTKNPKDL